MSQLTTHRRRGRAALLAMGLALGLAAQAPAEAAPRFTDPYYSTALVFVPTSSSTVVAYRNGVKTSKVLQPAARPFATHADSQDGGHVYLYNPGPSPDGLLRLTANGTAGVNLSFQSSPVGGSFTPLVGDFNDDQVLDIFWYAPGTNPDSLWLYDSDGSHTSKAINVNGSYRPFVARTRSNEFNDDIVWYGPGSTPDSIWQFANDGTYTVKSITVGGDYRPIVGEFGDTVVNLPDRVLWYSPSGADYLWKWDAVGGHTTTSVPNIDGSYQPIVGKFVSQTFDAILWYKPGTGAEQMWSFKAGGAVDQLEAPQVNGTYKVAVGDYDGSTYDDIAWVSNGKATLWKWASGGYSQQSITGLPTDAVPVAVPMQFTVN